MPTIYPVTDAASAVAPAATQPASAEALHLRHWPRRLPRSLAIPATSLWFNLEASARRWPDKPATLFFGQAMRYSELHAQAEALAGWLQAQGVQRGERVIVYMQNCPQYLVAVYGVLRADAVVVPVNPMNRAEEFTHYITDPQSRVALVSADLAEVVAQAQRRVPASQRLQRVLVTRYAQALPAEGIDPAEQPTPAVLDWLQADPPLPADPAPDGQPLCVAWPEALAAGYLPGPAQAGPDDLAMLPYTSGTTGLPKGCMHTHRTLMSNAVSGQWMHTSAESVTLAVVPMFHITGMVGGVLGVVYQGATMVILPRWDRELAGRLIARRGITHWTCIPTMVIDLFGSPNYRSFDLSGLRYLGGGGAAMPEAVAQRLKDEFGLSFGEGYGLTETAAPSHGNPPELSKLQCLGMPYFGVDSRIVDPDTLRELAPGETGEIVTHGPMVFKGYWGHEEATRAAFLQIDGRPFFRTGDLGRIDEDGYFFLTDRLKRMINASGFKVWPSEVELMLFKCPLVQEACVIATQDSYRGETVKAVVVLREAHRASAKPEDVVAWAREHMAAYKVPRIVSFVDSLPKSGAGKVMWRLLQEQEQEKERAGG